MHNISIGVIELRRNEPVRLIQAKILIRAKNELIVLIYYKKDANLITLAFSWSHGWF